MNNLERGQSFKIISFNIWGGRIHRPFLDWLKDYKDVDVFCFQEVFNGGDLTREAVRDSVAEIFSDIANVLKEHNGIYCVEQTNEEGEAIFVKKSLNVLSGGEEFVHKHRDAIGAGEDGRSLGRALQWVSIEKDGRILSVGNFHGLWTPLGKIDTPERLEQSKRLKEVMAKLPGEKVLMGDFNLLPGTKSLEILEQGYRNLITENGITNTRSNLYTGEERYADYTFVSEGVEVVDFKILNTDVSDHRPMYLEIK